MDSARHDSCRMTAATSGYLFMLCLKKTVKEMERFLLLVYYSILFIFECFYDNVFLFWDDKPLYYLCETCFT